MYPVPCFHESLAQQCRDLRTRLFDLRKIEFDADQIANGTIKLLQRRTAEENIAFALEALGAEKGEILRKANQALRVVGLERKASCSPSELSAGEQQRLAVARAIINDPVLLLADEPTGNLSLTAAEETIRLFEKINFRGTTVVLATHNEGLVSLWPKDMILLEQGRVSGNRAPLPAANG